jgi:adenylate cyclase
VPVGVSLKVRSILVSLSILTLSVLAISFASMHSLLLGMIVLFLATAALVPLAHNYEPYGPSLREKNDAFMFEACGSGFFSRARRLYRRLPANPRCRVCLVPFGGIGRVLRISPSRKNPNFCTSCIDSSPEGVHDMEVGVLFADIRGFTAWSASQPPSEAAKRVAEFYDVAGRVLMQDDALIEFVGDQVMALYLPAFPSLRGRTADVMLAAAERLVAEVQLNHGSGHLRIGVGVNFGVASIGNVRKGGQKDFTAVGDVVNTGARLQAAASAGEIVVAEAVYTNLSTRPRDAEFRLLEVKGKSNALPVYFLKR